LAVLNLLSVAVTECETAEGLSFLQEHQVAKSLRLADRDYQMLFDQLARGAVGPSQVGGNYVLLVLAQCCSLVGEGEMMASFVERAGNSVLLSLGSPFWSEYARGMIALQEGARYEVPPLRCKRAEVYWEPHLRLMSAIANEGDAAVLLAECEDAFARQNRDRSLEPDSYGVEGNGKEPVKWSFRLESFRRYWLSQTT
jgi:hypothetical protein